MNDINWISIPVELSSFDLIKNAVFEMAGDTPETRKALLACDEVLTNIVSYSGAANLAFSCYETSDLLCIAFSDDGIPFDPVSAPPSKKEFDLMDSGGMGLSMVHQCTAQMHYSYRNQHNVLLLQFAVKKPHGF